MSRVAIADRDDLRRGAWTAEEDEKLRAYVGSHGTGHWRSVGRKAGLQRCGKSCRLRWTNYLRPNIRHGSFTPYEEDLIVKLHSSLGSRWSLIAARMPGRTDNDIKNHWNTRLKKKLCNMGIDPVTHKPISELLRDIAGTMQPDGSSAAGCNNPMAAAGEEAARRCFSDNLLRKAVRDYSRTSAAASAPAGPSKYTDHSVISGAACATPDFNLHSCSDVELEQSAGDRQYCGDVSTLAAQSTSSLIQKEAAVVVDEDLHSWEHSISSTTSNCMSGHRNSCSEVDEVNLERSTSRSHSSRSMQSLQVNSTSSRSKNNMEAAASCWGSQLNITTDRRHHHLHHAADYTSPGTSPAAFLYLPTAPPLAAASSIKENNPTNNLELSFKSSSDQHHGNLIKELHEISRQFFPAASHGSCRSSTPTTPTTSGSRSSTTASQLVQRPPPPPVHNFLSDHYGDHQLVPCSWRTTSSMNAATAAAAAAAAAAGTSTTSSSAASTLQVDELAAAVQLLPCSSNKLQQYAVPMSSSRFSTDQSNLQLNIIKQHQQQPYFNFSDTFDMDLMKTRPHHIPVDQRQQQQQEDHHVENSMISRHEYYNNQINPAGLNFNQLQVTSDLELPAAAATGAYLRTQLREPISSSYNNNAAAAIVTSSSACTAHVAAPHQTLMSSFAAAATGSPRALSSSSFNSSAGPVAAAAGALHISNFNTGAPDPPLTMAMTTPAPGMNSTRVHGHHSYDHQNIQTSRVQVLWDFQE